MPEALQIQAAERTRKGALNLIQLLQATPPEKRHWKPLDRGRSIHEQAVECILVNRKWALTLQAGAYTRLPAKTIAEIEKQCEETEEEVLTLLQDSAEQLATAIMSLQTEQLQEQITAPFGIYSVADCCLLSYWNMTYHEGQINYIQTLYGDNAFHAHF